MVAVSLVNTGVNCFEVNLYNICVLVLYVFQNDFVSLFSKLSLNGMCLSMALVIAFLNNSQFPFIVLDDELTLK